MMTTLAALALIFGIICLVIFGKWAADLLRELWPWSRLGKGVGTDILSLRVNDRLFALHIFVLTMKSAICIVMVFININSIASLAMKVA